jgi:hypothetical protein
MRTASRPCAYSRFQRKAPRTVPLILRAWLLLSVGLATWGVAVSEVLAAVSASAPTDISVTLYRDPDRRAGPDLHGLDLDQLRGFALVTETRTVSLPAGVSRLRFEGVADGIQAESAIITGLPDGMLEKNHDAKVLSPASLVVATLGRNLWLVRIDPKTGKTSQVAGKLISDGEGVIFQSSEGLEALRCSGLPETFHFDATADEAATPTLSALVRSPAPVTAKVRLSYLARGFDWMATYTATVSANGKSMNLGAWVTLANGNAASFPQAHAQVVAGRLNRESGEVEPVDDGGQLLASCWPRGTTSDTSGEPDIERVTPLGWALVAARDARKVMAPMAMRAGAIQESAVAALEVTQEQLGDLKLYRVPERTSVSSRQVKQVRLLDRRDIPVELLYSADIEANVEDQTFPLQKILRTRNDEVHHLGLPLPSGTVDAFYERDGIPLLVKEGPLRDVTLDEEFEIEAGEAPDVEVSSVIEKIRTDLTTLKKLPLIPGVVHLRSNAVDEVNRIDISNARNAPVSVELRLLLPDGTQLIRSDHAPTRHNGHPAFRLTVPGGDKVTIRYQTEHTAFRPVLTAPQRQCFPGQPTLTAPHECG